MSAPIDKSPTVQFIRRFRFGLTLRSSEHPSFLSGEGDIFTGHGGR